MQSAAVMLVMTAVFALWLAGLNLRAAVEGDELERELYEHETRQMGWRLSKRHPQGRYDGEFVSDVD